MVNFPLDCIWNLHNVYIGEANGLILRSVCQSEANGVILLHLVLKFLNIFALHMKRKQIFKQGSTLFNMNL